MNKLIYLLGPIKSQPITEPDLLRLQKKTKVFNDTNSHNIKFIYGFWVPLAINLFDNFTSYLLKLPYKSNFFYTLQVLIFWMIWLFIVLVVLNGISLPL